MSVFVTDNNGGIIPAAIIQHVTILLADTTALVADAAEAESIAAAAEQDQDNEDAATVKAVVAPVIASIVESVAAAQQDYNPNPTEIVIATVSAETSTHFISSFFLADFAESTVHNTPDALKVCVI
ncbi:MAG: hypothetical protein ACOYU3_01385 [Bacillota bacterium]